MMIIRFEYTTEQLVNIEQINRIDIPLSINKELEPKMWYNYVTTTNCNGMYMDIDFIDLLPAYIPYKIHDEVNSYVKLLKRSRTIKKILG